MMKKKLAVLLAGAGVLLGCLRAEAAVTATPEGAGGADSIYVAGNPSWYPVEYYDENTECYEGLLPKILEEVGERTGLSFTYIRAGEEDQRARLAANSQVELVSGCERDEEFLQKYGLTESQSLVVFTQDGQKMEVCFAFTEIAGEPLIAAVESALNEISGQEIAGMAIELAEEKKGETYPVWLKAVCLGAVLLLILAVILLSVKCRKYKKADEQDPLFDPVIGIGNKEYFLKYFESYISEQYRSIYCVAYIGFDIERVNHYYGELEAENQLQFAANELLKSTADNEIVARVSGGGFAVAHPCSGEQEAEKWIEALLRRLNGYVEKFGKDYRPDFSAGIYMMKQTDKDGETVLFNARQGYQHAVRTSKPYEFSNTVLIRDESEKLQLRKRTREAIQNEEFKMFLQFIVDAGDGSIVGAESLSRWEHPQKGLLRPGSYIEVMESEKTIAELDFFIFEEVCHQLEQWGKEGRQTSISCNFTRITIDNENFIPQLQKIAASYLFDPSRLILEITEDVMEINKAIAFENISKCKELGFRIALDDAGSGYTSFADLRDYPIDIVKIDRSILNSAVNEKGIALLKGMIILAHSLGMEVLCEGVETEQQKELLRQLKCDYLQGYYFYRPLPKEEVNRILNETGRKNEA